jgi:hypothetical protein
LKASSRVHEKIVRGGLGFRTCQDVPVAGVICIAADGKSNPDLPGSAGFGAIHQRAAGRCPKHLISLGPTGGVCRAARRLLVAYKLRNYKVLGKFSTFFQERFEPAKSLFFSKNLLFLVSVPLPSASGGRVRRGSLALGPSGLAPGHSPPHPGPLKGAGRQGAPLISFDLEGWGKYKIAT